MNWDEFEQAVRDLYRDLERASEELDPAERRLRDGIGAALRTYDAAHAGQEGGANEHSG